MEATTGPLRELPSVDFLLRQPAIASLLGEFPRGEVLASIRAALDARRRAILAGDAVAIDTPTLSLLIRQTLQQRAMPGLRRVINATGIVLHTGLGRAPLCEAAIEAVTTVAAGYCNLEINLDTGERGDRYDHCRGLLRELTGADDALVVNNNAGATLVTLNALAGGREAVISRGQLVEIGGSYRMPDIMRAAGVRMVEVGTTNRTHLRDYERAIGPETAALVRVHTSNYRIEGFVATPPLAELAALAHTTRRVALIDDLGSGLLDRFSLCVATVDGQRDLMADWDEPTVRESLAAGADVVLFSGDKLLGGPQAGVILGRGEPMQCIRSSPLTRALRPDKLTLAALEATLRLYRDPAALARNVPIYRMLAAALAHIEQRARRLAAAIQSLAPTAQVTVAADRTYAGGGSLPTTVFDTWVVRLGVDPTRLADSCRRLRDRETPVIARLHAGAMLFDCRTVSDDDVTLVAQSAADALVPV